MESDKCAALDCKEISTQHALTNLIPNLKEGIPLCDTCYKKLFPILDGISKLCSYITEKFLCPFSDEWCDTGTVIEGTFTGSCIICLEFHFKDLIEKLDFDGIDTLVKAKDKVYRDLTVAQ